MEHIQRVYFLGIGGIGMSALARYFHQHGAEVYGYDRTETPLTKSLAAAGMHLHYEDRVELVPSNLDLAIWTPAIPADHQELNHIRSLGIPLLKRAAVLGLISKSKRCIGIGGTHGKTSTSTLTSWLLRATGVDITAFVGGISGNFASNYLEGKSDWVVVEADEYDRSFLQLFPEVAVVNAVDPDHLDIYGSEEEVLRSYQQFGKQLKPGGLLLLQAPEVANAGTWESEGTIRTFGIDTGDYRASNLRVEQGYSVFDLQTPDQGTFSGLRLAYPGRHNVQNAVAAIAAALYAGADPAGIPAALEQYKGVKRRFETIVKTANTVYIDDYAHHPAELKATIQAARSFFPGKKITGIFQPHLFSRTRDFVEGFAEALDLLDECLLLPIYPAREVPIPGVDSQLVLSRMKLQNKQIIEKVQVVDYLKAHPQEILLTMGAGDIDQLIEPIQQLLEQ
ncbi:MAG: UDP-N-acetylmuramate--L-alanine ligase [Chitinophagales bacterium]|jgi:UDP-N-acetylmuramate--alanine ligase